MGCVSDINFKGNESVHIILICIDGVRLRVQLILLHGKNGYEPLYCFEDHARAAYQLGSTRRSL